MRTDARTPASSLRADGNFTHAERRWMCRTPRCRTPSRGGASKHACPRTAAKTITLQLIQQGRSHAELAPHRSHCMRAPAPRTTCDGDGNDPPRAYQHVDHAWLTMHTNPRTFILTSPITDNHPYACTPRRRAPLPRRPRRGTATRACPPRSPPCAPRRARRARRARP